MSNDILSNISAQIFEDIGANEVLTTSQAEAVYQVLTSAEGLFKNELMQIAEEVRRATPTLHADSDFIIHQVPVTGGFMIKMMVHARSLPIKPYANFIIKNMETQPVELLYTFEIIFPNRFRSEGFGLTPERELIFIGSKQNILLDSPESLNYPCSMGGLSPWYTLQIILENEFIDLLEQSLSQ